MPPLLRSRSCVLCVCRCACKFWSCCVQRAYVRMNACVRGARWFAILIQWTVSPGSPRPSGLAFPPAFEEGSAEALEKLHAEGAGADQTCHRRVLPRIAQIWRSASSETHTRGLPGAADIAVAPQTCASQRNLLQSQPSTVFPRP